MPGSLPKGLGLCSSEQEAGLKIHLPVGKRSSLFVNEE